MSIIPETGCWTESGIPDTDLWIRVVAMVLEEKGELGVVTANNEDKSLVGLLVAHLPKKENF